MHRKPSVGESTIMLKKILVVCLFALPFIIRLFYGIETADDPYANTPILVSYAHHQFAQDLISGHGAPYTLFRPPYYALFLSYVYRMFGSNPLSMKIIQWILGGLSCWLVYFLARLYYGRTHAVLALLISSLYVPAVFFEGQLVGHPVSSFFALASVVIIAAARSARVRWLRPVMMHLYASLLFGFAALIRPDMLLAFPFLIITMWMTTSPPRSQKIRSVVVFTCGTGIFVLLMLYPRIVIPVEENYVNVNAAVNFYLGNNEDANGVQPYMHEVQEMSSEHPEARKYHITGLTLAMILYARTQTGVQLPSVASYWYGRAFDFIVSQPIRYVALELKKLMLFFNGFITTNQKDIYYMRRFSLLLRMLLFNVGFLCIPLGLIIPLAIVGLTGEKTGYRRMMLSAIPLACLMTVLLFFSCGRFMYPAVPFFIVLASHGIMVVKEKIVSRRWPAMAGTVLLILITNIDLFGARTVRYAQESFNAGNMYLKMNQPESAEQFFMESLTYDPAYHQSITSLCYLYASQDRPEKTISFVQKLPEQTQSSWAAMYGLANAYFQLGDLRNAGDYAQTLIDRYPDKPENYILRAMIYLQVQQHDKALETLRAGVDACPYYAPLQIQYGTMLASAGDYTTALDVFERVLSTTNHYPEAFYYAAYCLISLERTDQALTVLQNGLRHHPDDVSLLFLMAHAYEQLRTSDKALECYRRIIMLQPNNSEAYMRITELFAKLKRYPEALRNARTALELGHPDAQKYINALAPYLEP